MLKSKNESPGAVDNASAISILLSIAKDIKPKKYPVSFLFTSGEELGLIGAYKFCNGHKKILIENRSIILNLDVIGLNENLNYTGGLQEDLTSENLEKILTKVAKEKQIKLKKQNFIFGAMMDHIPFINCDVPAFSIFNLGKGIGFIHTKKDTCDLVNHKSLIVVKDYLLKIIEDFVKQ